MASTAATVFFCRPGRMSLRAVLTGFFDCAHVVCAIADAARTSKTGITKVLFILSSFQFGFQLAFSKGMLCYCYVRLGVYSLRPESHYRRQQQLLAESGPAEDITWKLRYQFAIGGISSSHSCWPSCSDHRRVHWLSFNFPQPSRTTSGPSYGPSNWASNCGRRRFRRSQT